MKSIRRSTTVYLLLLLTAALGAVGVAVDRRTGQFLAAREAAAAELIEARYQDRRRDEERRVDELLLVHARQISKVMQAEYANQSRQEWDRFRLLAHWLAVGAGPRPMPAAVAYAGVAWPGPVGPRLAREYFSHLLIDRAAFQSDESEEDDPPADIFQINSHSGRVWRSTTLNQQTLPFDPAQVDEEQGPFGWVHDDAALRPGGEAVRRVVMKVPLQLTGNGFWPRSGGPRGGPPRRPAAPLAAAVGGVYYHRPEPPRPPPPAPGLTPESLPRLYIQYARPKALTEQTLAGFRADRDRQLDELRAEIQRERNQLRGWFLSVGLVTFLALGVGGPLLVGNGLRPVRSLSEAVRAVSEKDFRLPHDGGDLPTELAPIHARLTQTLDQLRRAFEREKQSVADISHELRTPVASLLATLDVALRKPRPAEQYRTTLEECRAISRQLGRLVDRVMTLASLDAGRDRTTFTPVDAEDLAAGCVAVIRPLAAAHNVALDADLDPTLQLETDPDKLREVLMNLLHNAVEYNRTGGRIGLAARREGGTAVFEVRDTGIGMPAEVRDRIFERFYRADPSRTATGVHAGLGLAIVKEYVARLGGTIGVESTPGAGSTFRVTLPAAPPPADTPPPAPVPVGTAAGRG